jgi:hypothetical protein
MWHRLDRILGSRRPAREELLCEACGGPLGPDPALLLDPGPGRERRPLCSPECLPSVWKKVGTGRQKVSEAQQRDRIDYRSKCLRISALED